MNFQKASKSIAAWPISVDKICEFVEWLYYKRSLHPTTIKSYISNLRTIHKIHDLSSLNFNSFKVKSSLRGVENLFLAQGLKTNSRKVMTLPVLKILGHEISKKDWSSDSKCVIWSCMCVAFFGSFRIGELLPSKDNVFNPLENLLWRDVKFLNDNSVQIRNKVPKNRTPGGETVDLFPFQGSCCPVAALRNLKKLSKKMKILLFSLSIQANF